MRSAVIFQNTFWIRFSLNLDVERPRKYKKNSTSYWRPHNNLCKMIIINVIVCNNAKAYGACRWFFFATISYFSFLKDAINWHTRTYTNFLTVNGTNIVTNHSTHFSISSGSFSSVKFVIHLVHSLTFRIKSTKCKLLTCFTKLCKKSKTFQERSSIEVCILVCSGGNDVQDSRGVN